MQPRAGVVAAVALVIAALLVPATSSAHVTAVSTWHVAPWGSDDAAGTSDRPFRTIQHAVDRAGDHDSVVLRGGVYRESVRVADTTVHIRSATGERAVLDGAVAVTKWRRDGDEWVSDHWTRQFHREPSGASVDRRAIIAGYPDQVFLGDVALDQVLDPEAVRPGTFFHDVDADQLRIGDDPTAQHVRASDLRWGIYFDDADGSSLSDVTVRRFGTERSDMAAVRAYADDLVFSRVVVEDNARIGFSTIGKNTVVRDSRFVDNGHLGVHGDRVDGFVLERSAVIRNNAAGFDAFHSAGGVKLTRSTGITIRDSDISFNHGPGIWTDLDVDRVTLVRNLVEGNRRAGIEVELSQRVNVLGNVTIDNGEAGIWILESQRVQVMHNASFGNRQAIEIEEGPRREVSEVRVVNNTLGAAADGSPAVLDVNDWTGERSAEQMGVRIDHNAYWMPPTPAAASISRWARWPSTPGISDTLDRHRVVTGQADNSLMSVAAVNPFVRSIDGLDYRGPDWLPQGAPLTGAAADALGVAAGARLRIGPNGPLTRR